MNMERILRPVMRIHGGMLLPHSKGTADAESLIMPPPDISFPYIKQFKKQKQYAVFYRCVLFVNKIKTFNPYYN